MKSEVTVVLVEPEIPPNTGNIGRTCVAVGARLHLVGPLGFQMDDKRLKRAGLDYWPFLKHEFYTNWSEWERQHSVEKRAWFFSTKGQRSFYEVEFKTGDFLIFGKETRGLGCEVLKKYQKRSLFIPMVQEARSLNLATSVGIVLYEAHRQIQSL